MRIWGGWTKGRSEKIEGVTKDVIKTLRECMYTRRQISEWVDRLRYRFED